MNGRHRRGVDRWDQPRSVVVAALLGGLVAVGCVQAPAIEKAKEKAPSAASTTPSPPGGPASPAPVPVPSATESPIMAASTPVRLAIPAIGVDSDLVDLGLQPDGTLEVPPDGFPAGWFTGAPTPGELGPAVIAGHVDWNGRPGVFFALRDLEPGDDIAIARQDGTTAQFRVRAVEQFDQDAFPTDAVYGDLDHAGLRLITCAGAFDPSLRSYDDNLVVFAELVGSEPA